MSFRARNGENDDKFENSQNNEKLKARVQVKKKKITLLVKTKILPYNKNVVCGKKIQFRFALVKPSDLFCEEDLLAVRSRHRTADFVIPVMCIRHCPVPQQSLDMTQRLFCGPVKRALCSFCGSFTLEKKSALKGFGVGISLAGHSMLD